MSARRAWIDFQLKRAKNFWGEFRKSKRAIIGVAILVFYTIFALAAPFLKPSDPITNHSWPDNSAGPEGGNPFLVAPSSSQNSKLAQSTRFRQPTTFKPQE